MKVLITGGAGFIGSNLAIRLNASGYEVTVLDILSPQIHGTDPSHSELYNSIKNTCHFIQGDVRDKATWNKSVQDHDIIVHLAAETGTGQSMYEIHRYADTNICGTARMLDFIANNKTNIKKIVVASSRAIYGEGKYQCDDHGIIYPTTRSEQDMLNGDFNCKCPFCGISVELLPTDEDSKIHPTSIYGITKSNQEMMVHTIGKALNIPTVAFRYQNVYGPGQSLSNPYTGILSIFSTRIRNSNEVVIFEDGKESRDFVYIDDVVTATIQGIENERARYNSYNVGAGRSVSVIDIANLLLNAFHSSKQPRISGNFRLGDIRHNYADISKIQGDLGFKPTIHFEEGIKIFVNWVNTQHISVDTYEKTIQEMSKNGLYK